MAIARKIRCRVEHLLGLGEGVYTVDLRLESPAPAFKAGQFLHLTLDEYSPSRHWPESRVFSIASPSEQRDLIQICYSVKGHYTTRMERELAIGVAVWIKLPFGDFFVDDTQDVVLLAGGTGISAFSAFIASLRPGHSRDVLLAYGVRRPSHWLFNDLIIGQLRRVPRFRVALYCEQPDSSLPSVPSDVTPRLDYLSGRIAVSSIWPRLLNHAAHCFYLSGPPEMLTCLSDGLRAQAVATDMVRIDAW